MTYLPFLQVSYNTLSFKQFLRLQFGLKENKTKIKPLKHTSILSLQITILFQ